MSRLAFSADRPRFLCEALNGTVGHPVFPGALAGPVDIPGLGRIHSLYALVCMFGTVSTGLHNPHFRSWSGADRYFDVIWTLGARELAKVAF
jgi:hypothetical protein